MTSSSSEQTSLKLTGAVCHDPDPNSALEHFLIIVEKLLDKHAPYKNIKHPNSQFETKPWITPGLAYSNNIKNKLYKSFCKENDPHKKKTIKDNLKHNITLYIHYIERQKNLITNNTLETTKKPETSMADHKEDNKHEKQI